MNAMLSRVADSLYWMSRYLERADHVARQFDVHLTIVTEQAVDVARRRRRRLITCLVSEDEHAAAEASDYDLAHLLTFDEDNPSSLVNCIASARENARQVREQINSQMWEQINQMYLAVRSQSLAELWRGQPHNFYHWINQEVYRFQGITDSRITRDQGWHFIQIGRYLERASETADALNVDFRELYSSRAGDRRRRPADLPGLGRLAARLRRLRGLQQGLHRHRAAAPHRGVSAAQPGSFPIPCALASTASRVRCSLWARRPKRPSRRASTGWAGGCAPCSTTPRWTKSWRAGWGAICSTSRTSAPRSIS
jgi:uncharacterized alpha-E superfamily protein